MIVVDASTWVLALVESGPIGEAAREALVADHDWMAPAHTPIEVVRTLRRYEAGGILDPTAAAQIVEQVIHAELRLVVPDASLLEYVWRHRYNVSPNDAPYLGVTARFAATLVTNDVRLARAAEALDVAVLVPTP